MKNKLSVQTKFQIIYIDSALMKVDHNIPLLKHRLPKIVA